MKPKVGLIHDWLTGMRGGERCLEVFCELFPEAEIWTLLHKKGAVSSTIEKHSIRTSFIQKLPFSSTHYRGYLPFFPSAIESFDLNGYDLVISSSHCVAKGVPIPQATCHLAYIYTPMRYIWDQFDVYFAEGQAGWLKRVGGTLIRNRLQEWDISSNHQVHFFVAISQHVAQRIRSYYGKESVVVYPPVNWHSFKASDRDDGYYLIVTAFAPYKRVDLAIEASNRLGFHLKIIGTGQDENKLRRMAGRNVEFLGWQTDYVVREHYLCCKALIFPGEEDFGIVPLEAMACGKPVIAYGRGGVLETVVPLNPLPRDGSLHYQTSSFSPKEFFVPSTHYPSGSRIPTGIFFYEQTVDALVDAVRLFEHQTDRFDPEAIRMHVMPFDRAYFKEKMRDIIDQSFTQFLHTQSC